LYFDSKHHFHINFILEIKNYVDIFPSKNENIIESTENDPNLDLLNKIGDYNEIAIDYEDKLVFVGARFKNFFIN
jgi:hypothetical protein